jgi:hypothetical protein
MFAWLAALTKGDLDQWNGPITLCVVCRSFCSVRFCISYSALKFRELRATGERIIIDGPCLSACTLLTGIVPRNRVLGFHAASYYDDGGSVQILSHI